MIVTNRVPRRALAAIALTLAVAASSPRPAAASSDPVLGLLTALFQGALPDDPAGPADEAGLDATTLGDADLRRLLDSGIALAQQPVQYQQARPSYAPQYVMQAPAGGYQYVQNTVNAAVTYWTGQQPAAQPVATQPPAAQPAAAQQPAAAPAQGDPYGFTAWLNGIRGQYGLAPVAYDANLSAWANMNNAQQNSHGLGHHVMGPARRQNSAMGSAASIGAQWLASPPHAAALLDPSIRVIGIAGMGAFWTFNAY